MTARHRVDPGEILGDRSPRGGYLYFLTKFGIDQPSAVAYGVLWLLVIVANSLIGGLVFLASGARLPALRDTPV